MWPLRYYDNREACNHNRLMSSPTPCRSIQRLHYSFGHTSAMSILSLINKKKIFTGTGMRSSTFFIAILSSKNHKRKTSREENSVRGGWLWSQLNLSLKCSSFDFQLLHVAIKHRISSHLNQLFRALIFSPNPIATHSTREESSCSCYLTFQKVFILFAIIIFFMKNR